jgi:hypothetical protein
MPSYWGPYIATTLPCCDGPNTRKMRQAELGPPPREDHMMVRTSVLGTLANRLNGGMTRPWWSR